MRTGKRTWLRCSWLAPLMLAGLAACCCPKTDTVGPGDLSSEQQASVTAAREQLSAAEKRGSWAPDDDQKYWATIAVLPHETRLQLAKDLLVRLDNQKIKVIHRPRGTGPRVCPGLCPATRVTTTQTPGTTDVPGKPATAPTAPAVPAKAVPTPAVGKAVAK